MAGNRNVYDQAMRAAFNHSWNKDWKAAIEAYKHALVEFPQDVPATLGLGSAFLDMGQPKIALKAFERGVQLAPQDTDALARLADVQERLGNLEAAAATHTRRGHALAAQGDLEAAAEAWTQASRLDSEQVEAYLYLAEAMEELGRLEQASAEYATLASIAQRRGEEELSVEYCQQALRLNRNNSRAQTILKSLPGGRPLTSGDLDFWEEPQAEPAQPEPGEEGIFSFGDLAEEESEARTPAQQAQRRALEELAGLLFEVGAEGVPDMSTVSMVGRAIDLQTRGLLNEAIDSYRKALKRGLNRPSVYFNLGMLYHQQARANDAMDAFRHTIGDEAYALGSHYALGMVNHEMGRLDQALEHFLQVVKSVDLQTVHPGQVASLTARYQQVGEDYRAAGATEKASVFIQTLQEFFSGPRWRLRAREARRQMDNLAEDGGLMTLAEYLGTPQTEVVISAMALTGEYIRRNLLLTAAEETFRAIQKAPGHLPLHIRLAEIFIKQDHVQEAITKFLVVADTCEIRGDSKETAGIYQKVLRLAPMNVQVRSKLIDSLVRQGDVEQALEQYLALADVYYRLAQVDRALEVYNQALRLAPSSAQEARWKSEILHRLGDIYTQRVDWANATRAYSSLVAINPDDEKAQLALVDLYYKQGDPKAALRTLDGLLAGYQDVGKTQKALNVLREAAHAHPEEMELRARLAAAYAQQGMAKQAIAEYDALGEMQLELGRREEAARTIQTIIGLGPDDVEGYRRLYAQIKGGGV